jgi:glycosyltransferase involved in cell wall biosynthesis
VSVVAQSETLAVSATESGEPMALAAMPGVLCVTAYSDRPEAETFIGLHAAGFDIRVLCEPSALHYGRLEAAGVPVTPLSIKKRFDSDAVRSIRRLLETGRYGILHLFNNKAVLNGLRAARGHRVKIIAYRGIAGNDSFLSPGSWLRYLNPRVDRIVCVADAVRRHFLRLRLGPLHVAPHKPVLIYKGHDLAWYQETPLARAALGVPEASFLVGCVANWRPRKGIEVLIDAVAQLPRSVPIHLVLVGHMDSPRLRRRIATNPHSAHIHPLGYRADAAAIVAACDAAVLPSLKREGLPKSVIEAMAYGVAPIVTDTGGSPELIEHGISGLIVPSGDAHALAAALLRLYADPALRRRMGAAARDRIATRFSIRTTIAQTAALYRELAAELAAERESDS